MTEEAQSVSGDEERYAPLGPKDQREDSWGCLAPPESRLKVDEADQR